MPSYETLPEGAILVKDRTEGFLIIAIESLDLGLWWQLNNASPSGAVKVTLIKPDGTTAEKKGEDNEVNIVNSAPGKIKVLLTPADLNFAGKLKMLPEFLYGAGWLTAAHVEVDVIDDQII